MNNERRKTISTLISEVEEIIAKVETLRDDEQDVYDNMPESFQAGERGEKAQAAADALGEAANELESVKGNLETAGE